MAKVTGIGGVFLKAKNDNKALSAWYETHLGIKIEQWGGAILNWPKDAAKDKGMTVWNVVANDSDWFLPSSANFLINYRVDNMDEMIAQLQTAGIEILDGPLSDENGKFAWIMDPEGNKVELWEPMPWDEV